LARFVATINPIVVITTLNNCKARNLRQKMCPSNHLTNSSVPTPEAGKEQGNNNNNDVDVDLTQTGLTPAEQQILVNAVQQQTTRPPNIGGIGRVDISSTGVYLAAHQMVLQREHALLSGVVIDGSARVVTDPQKLEFSGGDKLTGSEEKPKK
jgi:hypothetical protein